MTARDLESALLFQAMVAAPLTRPDHRPRAWRLDTPLAQIYEIPGLLNKRECREVIEAIDRNQERSKTAAGISGHRTSQTCYLAYWEPDLAARVDRRCADLIGMDPAYSDPLQGQRYSPGETYGGHTDWFSPDDPLACHELDPLGQRTWTVMIYLNSVEEGGQTLFHRIGRRFEPVAGMGLAWNNLYGDGGGNPYTLHGGLKVHCGVKYIVTKWFRQYPRRTD